MAKQRKATILFADDDRYSMRPTVDALKYRGYEVLFVTSGSQTLKVLQENRSQIDLVILDIMMPPGNLLKRASGERTGIEVARMIKEQYPDLPIVASTVVQDPAVLDWFREHGNGVVIKPYTFQELSLLIEPILNQGMRPFPKCFIVHGHDHKLLYELKSYLQNELNLGEPVILRDKPSLGRTIIEKFEQEAHHIDIVFVLLTPDDIVQDITAKEDAKRRARQNVIFELGYFYAKLQRTSGRVILLFSGNVEIPADISGIAYIDVTAGIKASGEKIRSELADWLK